MSEIKIGDKLKFKKFHWIITEKRVSNWGVIFYKYKVVRKYKKILLLSNTKCTYDIAPDRWNFLKQKLKENKNYHYTMSLWSNQERV